MSRIKITIGDALESAFVTRYQGAVHGPQEMGDVVKLHTGDVLCADGVEIELDRVGDFWLELTVRGSDGPTLEDG